MKSINRLQSIIPNVVVVVGIVAILVDDAFHATLGTPRLVPIELRMSLLATVVGGLVWLLTTYRKRIETLICLQKHSRNLTAEIIDDFESLDLTLRYRTAKTIRILNLAGTQFGQLGRQSHLESLFDVAGNKTVRILLGDPRSVGVELRYKPGYGEPSTHETGLVGLDRRIRDLYGRYEKLTIAQRKRLEIRLFGVYPTVSMVQLDEDIYSAAYGLNLRGGDCPKLHTVLGGKYSSFLITHFDNVFDSATPIEEWIKG